MRQTITQKEWDELNKKEKQCFLECMADDNLWLKLKNKKYSIDINKFFNRITIGILWEVLENKIECIFAQSEKGTWVVDIKDRASLPKQFEDKEPIVALWKAYKFTLTI